MDSNHLTKNLVIIGRFQMLGLCSLAISCSNDSSSSIRKDMEAAIGMKMAGEARGLAEASQLKTSFDLPLLTKLLDDREMVDRSELVVMQFETPKDSNFGMQKGHEHEDFVVTGVFDESTGIPRSVVGK